MEMHAGVFYVIAIFGAALLVGVVAERLRFPYIVALLLVSLPLPPLQSDKAFVQSFLFILLPTLIFEAAWNLDVNMLRRTWRAISFMAVIGVIVTVLAVGFGLSVTGQMPLMPALLLGAIVAPTDPIAVIATFRRLSVPDELAITVEGESLFNDGTGVVLYGALAIAVLNGSSIHPGYVALDAVIVALGGSAIGATIAFIGFTIVRSSNDRNLHVVATIIVAYGSYLIADAVHASGIFGALCGGIVYRALERRRNVEDTAQHVDTFWGIAAFVANTAVFLILGARIEVARILSEPWLVLSTLVLVIVARVALCYGTLPFLGIRQRSWQHVMALCGIRGGISIAIALALPAATPHRDQILDAVYGVVAFTIFSQGLALEPIMKRLKLEPQA